MTRKLRKQFEDDISKKAKNQPKTDMAIHKVEIKDERRYRGVVCEPRLEEREENGQRYG